MQTVDKPSVDGTPAPVRLFIKTQKTASPTVLLSHGSACVVPGEYMWADMVFDWGYNAVIIDHCSLRGVGRHTDAPLPSNLQNEHRVQDYLTVANWLNSQAWHNGKTGVIGFSRGGEGVIHLASAYWYVKNMGYEQGYSEVVDAAVSFYPNCRLELDYLVGSPFPILFHHGKLDQLTPISRCRYPSLVADKLLKGNVFFVTYDNAHHSFDRPGTRNVLNGKIVKEYDHDSAKKSYAETKKFLDEYLKARN